MTYAEFKEAYEAFKLSDKVAAGILRKVSAGTATYTDAAVYAKRIGAHMSKLFGSAFAEGIESLIREDVVSFMLPSMSLGYADVASLSGEVNTAINAAAKVGLKTIVPEPNKQRIFGIIDKMLEPDQLTAWMLGDDVMENFTRSAVTDTIDKNAQLASDAGLTSYISRTAPGGCCEEFCAKLLGTYEYGKQPSDFFAVHKDCTCEITYMPSKKRWQKITFETVNNGGKTKIKKNTVDI